MDTVSLQVTGTLKAGDGHNSQALTVEALDSTSPSLPRKGTGFVAKIYDPLYFGDDDGYLDPFRCMDKYYTHEANAYPALREFQGRDGPTYHGSYTPRVVFVDLAHALFDRRRDDPAALTLNCFLGDYISPPLRWNEAKFKASPFDDWVDWDWDPWLTAEFAHTVTSITPEMREQWADI
ncbi:hypothetical protein BO99DRAFT_467055 [Aspergillus violaceofuscus CBS 115571]|uniref:Uncharacterized protein n=1 Tax=Aspergillus violaceofuscus (strain CBS 115571) TaxID=1450538 RepID=A0A2V5GXD9_ASPV1|nr:hypothetical protein BO99DRAFT_467055 [Aspergillus violaceofuscus CBS 115571]